MLFKFFLFLLIFFSRFFNLHWGGGYFFHPDENNMARSIAQMSWGQFHPHFFAYGQFPLYLSFLSGSLVNFLKDGYFKVGFSQAVYWLRFWSAFFSSLSLLLGYLLAQFFFEKKEALIYLLFLIFTPGLIQAAHFGTTESILVFVFLFLVYFSLSLLKTRGALSLGWILLFSLGGGIGLATKVSAFLFFLPVVVSWLLVLGGEKEKKQILRKASLFFFSTGLFFILFSPFYFLDFKEAWSTINYEAQVATGKAAVFYTRQFVNTLPIVFPLKKIFPWVLGPPLFLIFLGGVVKGTFLLFRSGFRYLGKKKDRFWLIFHLSWLSWFIFNSFLFAKWVRFMVPILPFLVLLAAWFLFGLKERLPPFLYKGIIITALVPGFIFLKIYLSPDIRWQASRWLNQHLPPRAIIVSEAGNVVDLPLFNQKSFRVINFDFYSLDKNQEDEEKLQRLIAEGDYFLLPSRRVFANYLPLATQYPRTVRFYHRLFSGELGFFPLTEFKPFSRWQEYFLGSDLTAEETWTVFDHPTIRIYQKKKR